MKLILGVLMFLGYTSHLYADTYKERFTLTYPLNSSVLHRNYRDNKTVIDSLEKFMRHPLLHYNVDSITIVAYASPEGIEERNNRLATNRANSLYDYFTSLKKIPIRITSAGENWEGLYKAVYNDPLVPDKNKLLYLLEHKKSTHTIKQVLRQFNSTVAYEYVVKNILPQLREATAIIYKTPSVHIENNSPHITIIPIPSPPLPEISFIPLEQEKIIEKYNKWAIKTNLLYLAALAINVEGEYYFNKKYSINLEWQYAWWQKSQKHKYYRIAAISPEFRYWFGKRGGGLGHFTGVYAMGGLYEFMKGEYSTGRQGEFFIAAGLSYGYTFKLNRIMNLELSLGLGYLLTEYREYHYDDNCYVYDMTKRYSYFGITKAKASLVFPLYKRGRK